MAAGAKGRGRMRASHADREQVIETLKVAFVHGRLTRDELGTRAGRALSAPTRADLAALTADIPPAPAAAGPARPPAPARGRPLARAAVQSGICLAFAAAAVWAAFILDPGPRPGAPGSSEGPGVGWCFVLAIYAVIAAVCIMGVGVARSKEQRRSRRQLPPRPGPDGPALEAGRDGGNGHEPVPPGSRTDQTCADLRTDSSRPGRPHSSGRGARAPHGIRPAPGPA
jgi:hypothetical protein